jgi:hypothetical protein
VTGICGLSDPDASFEKSISINKQPAKGTSNAARRLLSCVDSYPTSQGTLAPPNVESANITPATRDAAVPNLEDKKPIVIG